MEQPAKIKKSEEILSRIMLNVEKERKDPKAWVKLKKLSKSISKAWKVKTPSWEVISNSRN